MYRGLYTVTASMLTNEKKLDVISNNLSNANTTGYKKDVVTSETFPEVLLKKVNGNMTSQLNQGGPVQLNMQRDGVGYNISTNKGYFTVETSSGKSYSKSVRCAVDENGYLKTYTRDVRKGVDPSTGNFLLDGNGNRIQVNPQNPDLSPQNLIYMPPKNVIGTINIGSRVDRIQTNFMGGGLEDSSNPLDLAIDGDGFFRIETPNGIKYTRDGAFNLDRDGFLVTKDGSFVLGQNGRINLSNAVNIVVNEDGDVFAKNGEIMTRVDRLQTVDFLNINALRKEGNNLYRVEDNIDPEENVFRGLILQGKVEKSNVSNVNEMIDMINLLREYESGQKVIKSYDEMMGKAVNEIGKV